ncbi:MAG: hypothetical protein OXQ92_01510 [Boseongicola sp.]|nr:hypothetical protein [Boseongicola sp.]MDD9979308.1 hypothetical protein [Boseongicola sp.]
MKAIRKFQARVREYGLAGAIHKTISKATTGSRRNRILKLRHAEDRFTEIYNSNHWNDLESKSGSGSTIEFTQHLRSELPEFFERHDIKTVLDVPCGDFNWMKLVIQDTDIVYIGGDIVQPLIDSNTQAFADEHVSFQKIDLTADVLPECDLLICRDCWIHLSERDILLALENIISAKIPRTLVTSNGMPTGPRLENRDIPTGDMRPIDLFSKPYGLDFEAVEILDDSSADGTSQRCMPVLTLDEAKKMRDRIAEHLELD